MAGHRALHKHLMDSNATMRIQSCLGFTNYADRGNISHCVANKATDQQRRPSPCVVLCAWHRHTGLCRHTHAFRPTQAHALGVALALACMPTRTPEVRWTVCLQHSHTSAMRSLAACRRRGAAALLKAFAPLSDTQSDVHLTYKIQEALAC